MQGTLANLSDWRSRAPSLSVPPRLLLRIIPPLVEELAQSLHINPTATMSHTQFLVTCTSVTHDYQANLNSYIKCVCHTRTCSASCENEVQMVSSNLMISRPSMSTPCSALWSATRTRIFLFQQSTHPCLKAWLRAVQRTLGYIPGSGNCLAARRVHELTTANKRSAWCLVSGGGGLGTGAGVSRQAMLIRGMLNGTRF